MRKTAGFTLIELMIIIAIVAILAAIFLPLFTGDKSSPDVTIAGDGNTVSNVQLAADGMTCVEGLLFIKRGEGQPPRQVVDQKGQGVTCTATSSARP